MNKEVEDNKTVDNDGKVTKPQEKESATGRPNWNLSLPRERMHSWGSSTAGADSFLNSDDRVGMQSMNAEKNSSSTGSKAGPRFFPKTKIWEQQNHFGDGSQCLLDYDDDTPPGCYDVVSGCWVGTRSEIWHFVSAVLKHPTLLMYFLVALAVLTTASVLAVNALKDNFENDLKFKAEQTALETAEWFRDEFQRALLPLYSIQQAVLYSPYFQHLSHAIGESGAIGSAPTITGPKGNNDYRDVTGICDDDQLQHEFDLIVEQVNKANDVDGCIVQYRLAPHAVFCLISPKVNDKDFGPGKVFNASGSVGRDLLLTSPWWHNTVSRTLQSPTNAVDIFGPVKAAPGGILLMPEMFCAHLAVDIPGNSITIDDEEVERWGFVMSFIHWEKFKERSDIYERFREHGMEFQLTRTDRLFSEDEGGWIEKVNSIAESENAEYLGKLNSLEITVQTQNGEWVNRVGIVDGFTPSWYWPVLAMVVVLSFFLSFLFLCILVERKLHKKLLYKMLPQRVIQKLQRGLTVVESYPNVTIFFSDIIGFTTMAGEMNAFLVMDMLNDLYNEFDRLVEKHGVYKVETIGDAYMVVGGAPTVLPNSHLAAQRVALFALEAMEVVKAFTTKEGERIYIRAGLHSGPVMAGVVGTAMPRYCFFGDSVNMGSRMESTSSKLKIQCSPATQTLLNYAPDYDFDLEQRRDGDQLGVHVKGKGKVETWWIKGATQLRVPRLPQSSDMIDAHVTVNMEFELSDDSETKERLIFS